MVLNISQEQEKHDKIIASRVEHFTKVIDTKLLHNLEDLFDGKKMYIDLRFAEGESSRARILTVVQLKKDYAEQNKEYDVDYLEIEDNNYVLTFEKRTTRGGN